jgi:hypothetical protein
MQRCGAGLGLVGVVHTRRWAVQRPRDDCTIGATMVPRRALRCGSPGGAVRAAVAVVEPYSPQPWLARVKQLALRAGPQISRGWCGARQTRRYPSSSADSFPLLLRARNSESARSPGEKTARV